MNKPLNKYIDHTLLKADAGKDSIAHLCQEAVDYDFYSVCVNSSNIELAVSELAGTGIRVCSTVGFPLGAMATETKIAETVFACDKGASEIDAVINIAAMKSGDYDLVEEEIRRLAQVCHDHGNKLKTIIEISYLTEMEIVKACEIAMEGGADFVKTSTGFSEGGATVRAVALMHDTVGDYLGVKASGGISDRETALKMIKAGANRLGTSKSINIVSD